MWWFVGGLFFVVFCWLCLVVFWLWLNFEWLFIVCMVVLLVVRKALKSMAWKVDSQTHWRRQINLQIQRLWCENLDFLGCGVLFCVLGFVFWQRLGCNGLYGRFPIVVVGTLSIWYKNNGCCACQTKMFGIKKKKYPTKWIYIGVVTLLSTQPISPFQANSS